MSNGYKITKNAFNKFNNASDKINEFKGSRPHEGTKPMGGIGATLIKVTGRIPLTDPVLYTGIPVVRNDAGVYGDTGDGRSYGADLKLRHIRNDYLQTGIVVKATLTSGEDGDVWVTEYETTQESFKLVAVDDGNETLSSSGFVMLIGGFLFSNYGQKLLNKLVGPEGQESAIEVHTGQTLFAHIEFIKGEVGSFSLGDCYLDTVSTELLLPYRQENDYMIVINVPIAEVLPYTLKLGFLQRYQTNDILLDISQGGVSYTIEDDPDDKPTPIPYPKPPIGFTVGNKWIKKRGVNEIYHSKISEAIADEGISNECNWMRFKALKDAFDCSSVSFSTVQDVEDWVNDELLANILQNQIDSTGHTNRTADCDGTSNKDYPDVPVPPEYPPTTPDLSLTLTIESSPTEYGTDEVIETQALLENAGAYFADWDGLYNIKYTMSVGGNAIKFDNDGAGAKAFFGETSINSYIPATESGNLEDIYADLDCYYNETGVIVAEIPLSGLSDRVYFSTTIVNLTITASLTTVKNGDALTITASLTNSAGGQFTDFDDDEDYEMDIALTWPSGAPVLTTDGQAFSNYNLTISTIDTGVSGSNTEDLIGVLEANEGQTITISAYVRNVAKGCNINIDGSTTIVSEEYPDAIIDPEEVTLLFTPSNTILTTDVEGVEVGEMFIVSDNTAIGGELGGKLG